MRAVKRGLTRQLQQCEHVNQGEHSHKKKKRSMCPEHNIIDMKENKENCLQCPKHIHMHAMCKKLSSCTFPHYLQSESKCQYYVD